MTDELTAEERVFLQRLSGIARLQHFEARVLQKALRCLDAALSRIAELDEHKVCAAQLARDELSAALARAEQATADYLQDMRERYAVEAKLKAAESRLAEATAHMNALVTWYAGHGHAVPGQVSDALAAIRRATNPKPAPAAESEPDPEFDRLVANASLAVMSAGSLRALVCEARARIADLERKLAALQDVRADLADQDAKNQSLECELAAARDELHPLRAAEKRMRESDGMARDNLALRAAIGAAVVSLTSAYVMSSQDAGQVVCSSVVEDVAEALRAAQKAAT